MDIYLDHAAATPVDPAVQKAMQSAMRDAYANPSSRHAPGTRARTLLEDARTRIANELHVDAVEIIFTSGGTESNNLAIHGIAHARGTAKGHLITTAIEHASVLEPFRALEREGFDLTILPVDTFGRVDPAKLRTAMRPNTILVSIMYANNETGTIQDIPALARIAHERGALFHTDASQSITGLDFATVDLATINGAKIYGPKGTGILVKKQSITLAPLFFGGGQEHALRSGTENVLGIVGLAKAIELAKKESAKKYVTLRKQFLTILRDVPRHHIHGHFDHVLPTHASISFEDVDGETLAKHLSHEGIFISTGSACTEGHIRESPVLRAMGISAKEARETIRITFGRTTTQSQVEKAARAIIRAVSDLRTIGDITNFSPLPG